jgi:MoaA/NifB/PqqE/SkfB family radical SAM enzyme
MMKDQLYCHEPFRNLEVTSKGDVFLCCATWLPTSIGNLNESSLEEVWNGEIAKKIRASILDGTFQFCEKKQCPRLQTIMYPVVRVEDIQDFDLLEKIANINTSTDSQPKSMVWCHDHTCNLSCPSCRTAIKALNLEEKNRIEKMQSKIFTALPSLEQLIISGDGDPFASKLYSRFLEEADSKDFPKLKIFLQTNALLFNPDRWARMKKIQPSISGFFVSIDAAKSETYALNRRGGNFENLCKSLYLISKIRKENPHILFYLSFIVQKNNWREMEDFIELGKSYSADKVLFTRLANWGTYSEKDFVARDVSNPSNSDHVLFLEKLKRIKEKFDDPDSFVQFENLSHLFF